MPRDSWFVLPERKRRVFKTTADGSTMEEEETYYDAGDMAGLAAVAIAGSIMIMMFSGIAAYKQYLNETSS
jgi:hypothetical protein